MSSEELVKTLPSATLWFHAVDDERIQQLRLQGGCPISWHQQRLDALVTTPQGLVYYGTISSPGGEATPMRLGAIGARSMLNLNALGSHPLGLASFGSLVCTLSNPSVVVDLSIPGRDVIFPLVDVADVSMMNAMKILHIDAVRQMQTAPLDHLLFTFCTNEGVLAAKVFHYPSLVRYLDSLRANPNPQTVRQPESQLIVLHRSDEEPINDFSMTIMHPDRNAVAMVMCFDAPHIDVARVRLTSSGTRLDAGTMVLQRIQTGAGAPLRDPLTRIENFFTYVAAAGRYVLATGDNDRMIAVFESNWAEMLKLPTVRDDDESRLVLRHIVRTTEIPYKVVHVAGNCFLVACQRVVYCVEATTGASVSIPLPKDVVGSICGMATHEDGVAYVAVTHATAQTQVQRRRFLRLNVSARPQITLSGLSQDIEFWNEWGDRVPASVNPLEQASLDNFSLHSQASQWLRTAELSMAQRDVFALSALHRCHQEHVMEERGGGTPQYPFVPTDDDDEVPIRPMICRYCRMDQQTVPYFWCAVCGEVLCTVCVSKPRVTESLE
ncbi:Hypothetical protein, putative [Bodo saltans]|uniref:Uncharacterized protein n=1 Tax=Bodo saltans TaxID=75058 RepID=A0A0S4IYY6_BODSA|nr:Hypothetical protein, putative [Bodo saltans]|eukprot:CUG61527.1 Hypothetical protein, putative [Bodo saltans]